METLIYNIDSAERNIISFPNSHSFTLNKVDSVIDGIVRVEPFQIKNAIEINISNIEIPNTFHFINSNKNNNTFLLGTTNPPTNIITIDNGSYSKEELMTELSTKSGAGIVFTYSSTSGFVTITNTTGSIQYFKFNSNTLYPSLGSILGFQQDTIITINNGSTITAQTVLTLPQEPYVFLKINDYGNIIHREQKYVAKLVPDNSSRFDDMNSETIYRTISTKIVFDQPKDINNLKISLIDKYNNYANINNANFSFTLEIKTINNSILKQYEEIRFYNDDVMRKILNARMLEFYEKESKNYNLTRQYHSNIQQNYNNIEYNYDGNRNNYK